MEKVTIVLGLGTTGVAAAEFLLKQNHLVLGIDGSDHLLEASSEIHRLKGLGLFAQHECHPIEWSRVKLLVVSPGVSSKHPIYEEARKKQIPITGEAEIALQHLNSSMVAVTGTNGKTTVALLVEHVLKSQGIRAKALGNVGVPLCSRLISPTDEEVLVVELSSYQLETMRTPKFEAAALLNISPDHLDRYADMQEYARAKFRLQYTLKKNCPLIIQEEVLSAFGRLLDYKNVQTFGHAEEAGKHEFWSNYRFFARGDAIKYPVPQSYHEGNRHDCENALAAWALCQPYSIAIEQFCAALSTFKKPKHRIEFVREKNGVAFYDDSKGTNIDAVIKAVKMMQGPVILIAGGVDKGSSYLLWKTSFLGKVKQIITLGESSSKIHEELHPHFKVVCVDSLPSAVCLADSIAEKGDAILLSPGCSSFDMFRDYAHRGMEFQRCVHDL